MSDLPKIDFSRCRTRKDFLELLSDRMKSMPTEAAAEAWARLADSLDSMTHPERPTPKFWAVILEMYGAYLHGSIAKPKSPRPLNTDGEARNRVCPVCQSHYFGSKFMHDAYNCISSKP